MKRIIIVLLVFAVFASMLFGCSAINFSDPEKSTDGSSVQDSEAITKTDAVLYTVIGNEKPKEHKFSYEKNMLTPEMIAQVLFAITGHNFSIKSSVGDDGSIIIEWTEDSALFKGPKEGQTEGEFKFFDADTFTWFMLNSLCLSLRANYKNADIYYVMKDGTGLEVPEVEGAKFSAELAYNKTKNENIIADLG